MRQSCLGNQRVARTSTFVAGLSALSMGDLQPETGQSLQGRNGMPSALAGIHVIDFGQYIAGPLTGMLLADQGADVIRIDPPGGPVWDTPANATWNRGKRSISLDLKQPADLNVARRLMASADVVIENFRPGVMARLGLGA